MSACQQTQTAIEASQNSGPKQPLGLAELDQHLEHCSECARYAVRVGALRDLGLNARLSAPSDLDGMVVAALHEGHRQQRAVDHLRASTAVALDRELDEQLAHSVSEEVSQALTEGLEGELGSSDLDVAGKATRLSAPDVLDRLVSEELGDGQAAERLVARHLGRMPRLSAPQELQARVARELSSPSVQSAQRGRPWITVGAWVATAAAVLLVVFPPRQAKQDPSALALSNANRASLGFEDFEFKIVPVDDDSQMSGMARAFFGSSLGRQAAPKSTDELQGEEL